MDPKVQIELNAAVKTWGLAPVREFVLCNVNTSIVAVAVVINDQGRIVEFLLCDRKAYVECLAIQDLRH